jgi:mono/diheme cytochrome c family protein
MRARGAWLMLAAALLCGCRRGNPQQAGAQGPAMTGRDLYMTNCAACHNVHGEGIQGEGLGQFPALNGSQWVDGPPERLAAIVLDGMQRGSGNEVVGVMPAWKNVWSDAQIASVMTYIREWDGKPPVTSAEVSRVRQQTQGRNTFWTEADLMTLKVR